MFKRNTFLIQNGQVYISKKTGEKISMPVSELARVSGVDLSDKEYVCYEPDLPFFEDSQNPEITEKDVPNQLYDAAIGNVATLIARYNNPLYGLSGAERERKEAELARAAAAKAKAEALAAEREKVGTHKYSAEEIYNYIDNEIDKAATAAEKIEAIKGLIKKLALYVLDPYR